VTFKIKMCLTSGTFFVLLLQTQLNHLR